MKFENKDAFEQCNMFGIGTANTAYAKYFIGDAFLNPLTDSKRSFKREVYGKVQASRVAKSRFQDVDTGQWIW